LEAQRSERAETKLRKKVERTETSVAKRLAVTKKHRTQRLAKAARIQLAHSPVVTPAFAAAMLAGMMFSPEPQASASVANLVVAEVQVLQRLVLAANRTKTNIDIAPIQQKNRAAW
jgi:hypothetical protein